MATPGENVEKLDRRINDIFPETFKEAFDQILSTTSDLAVLSRLMWIAGMYLDRNPGAFELPAESCRTTAFESTDYDQLLAEPQIDSAQYRIIERCRRSFREGNETKSMGAEMCRSFINWTKS